MPEPALSAPAGPDPVPDEESADWWAALRSHRLMVQRCVACGRHRFPLMPACPWCAGRPSDFVEVSGRGAVYSFITVHRALPGYGGPVPGTIAVVQLDEGPRMLGRIPPGPPPAVGDRVEVCFVDHAGDGGRDGWTEACFRRARDGEVAGEGDRPRSLDPSSAPPLRAGPGVQRSPGPRAAVVGVGYSPLTKSSDESVLALALGAVDAALDDAGLEPSMVDGMGSFMVNDDSVPCVATATAAGAGPLRWAVDLNLGGQAPCHLVWQAAQAVSRGDAEVVVVYRALKGRSGARVGGMQFPGMGGQFRYPIGYAHYMMYVAMWARRFLYETGQGAEDLASVAISQRWYAERNPRAIVRRPLDLAAYLDEPYVVEPFRHSDCTVEVDGACALVVASVERARDLRRPPAVVASGCYRAGPRPGLDIGDHLLWDDYTRNYTTWLREELFGRAGIGPDDVQVAEIYDCFTSTVLMGLEGLGLCQRGAAGAFVREGNTGIDGVLPTNTGGGLLAEGYLHGINTIAEAALQVQGRCGERQAPRHEVGVVTSGALMDGSALVLHADR